MNPLLITLAIHADNAPQAETLIDWCYALNGKSPLPTHILLACSQDTHAEMRTRLRIASEVSFMGVHELEIRPLADTQTPKVGQVNSAFRQIAQAVQDQFGWPYIFLEPDCVPTQKHWLESLSNLYYSQPRLFVGTKMRTQVASGEDVFFMARVGMYPQNAATKLFVEQPKKAPIEFSTAEIVMTSFTGTKLIQQCSILAPEDVAKVRSDSVLLHGDKAGHLLRKLEAELQKTIPNPAWITPDEPRFDDVKCFNSPMPPTVDLTKLTGYSEKLAPVTVSENDFNGRVAYQVENKESVPIAGLIKPIVDPFDSATIVVESPPKKKRGRPSKMEIEARNRRQTL